MENDSSVTVVKFDEEIDKAFEYQDKAGLILSLLSGRIKTLEKAEADAVATTPRAALAGNQASATQMSGIGNQSQPRKDHHLPKQELTTFSGDPLKWSEFWDDFECSVHSQSDIPEVRKFKYLKQYLRGDALSMLEGFSLTAANYHEVVKLLKERYGDPQIAIFSHFEALLAIPEASREVAQLRSAYNQAEAQIRSLVALGLEEDNFGQVFVPILLSKMPLFVRVDAHRKNGSSKWELANLRRILKEEIEARERAVQQFMKTKREQNVSEQRQRGAGWLAKPRPTHSGAALVTAEGKREPTCAFCSGSHYSDSCGRYRDYESRQRVVREQRLCQLCLGPSHRAADCRFKRNCWHCGQDRHHRSLCRKKFGKSENANIVPETDFVEEQYFDKEDEEPPAHVTTVTAVTCNTPTGGFRTIMQTALGDVCGPKGQTRARFIFDTASSRSFVTRAKADEIGAKFVRHDRASLGRFRENQRSFVTYPIVELEIMNYKNERRRVQVAVVDAITTPIQLLPLRQDIQSDLRGLRLAEVPVTEVVSVTVDFLVGLDWYFELMNPACIVRLEEGLVLTSSFFGYVAGGRATSLTRGKKEAEINMLIVESAQSANFELEKFWSLEDLGVKDSPTSKEDEIALRKFQESLQFIDNRFYVKWPFKDGMAELPSNYSLALGRLRSLLHRNQNNPSVVEHYNRTFREQLESGIIEVAPQRPSGIVHYIPHQCVLKASSNTTKFRVVMDASAKSSKQNRSINDCFYHCPLILSDLVGVILRFRRWKIAITGDIEKAYLQIGLQETERDCTRFLWVKDATKPVEPQNVIIYRFKRVAFGFGPSAFLLSGSVDHLLLKEGTAIALEIRDDKFVDNVFGGRETASEATVFVSEAIRIFRMASMKLREWYSNDGSVISNLPVELRGSGSATKILGLKWETDSDLLSCQVGFTSETVVRTKRQILKAVATVYDPCGFFTPVTVKAKLILQQLWLREVGWDEQVSQDVLNSWARCSADLLRISSIRISRQFQSSVFAENAEVELHCFCDASSKAYAAVVYVRIVTPKKISSNLVISKGRVSPVKKELAIPKLELMAAFIGSRLIQFVEKEIRVSVVRKFLWTDSKVTLHWIKGKQKYTVFVENRVKEIRGVDNLKFRYVPTDQNPADLPSRGISADELHRSALWWNGPKFLEAEESEWPNQDIPDRSKTDRDEVESADVHDSMDDVAMVAPVIERLGEDSDAVLDISKFSTLGKLCRVTAYVFRFAYRHPCDSCSVTAAELEEAKWYWVKQMQSHSFCELMTSKAANCRNKRVQLGLFADENGIIRCRGRLENSTLPYDARYPVLLPKRSYFTQLVIKACHEKVFHAGPQHTLGELRTNFWVPHGRARVKWVLKNCVLCRKHQGGPYRVPEPPPLPGFRVSPSRPFSHVGLDYLGHIFVKSQGDDPRKVWVCLFTCAAVRAIHLEVVRSMSTEEFLLCLRRFMALHGVPDLIISDNAKQFHAASKNIQRMWSDVRKNPAVRDFVSSKGIEWRFITQLAPWFGGFYERLVNPVKRALKRSFDKRLVDLAELQTLVYEVARVVNSRPLIQIDSEVGSNSLTPAHFLLRDNTYIPTGKASTRNNATASDVIRDWKRAQQLLDSFWEVWRKQYLAELRARLWSHHQRDTATVQPKVGVVVQVADKLPRMEWRLGKISDLIVGADGKVRSATVRLANGIEITRSIKFLHPLEYDDSPKQSKKRVAAIPGVLDSEAETSDDE